MPPALTTDGMRLAGLSNLFNSFNHSHSSSLLHPRGHEQVGAGFAPFDVFQFDDVAEFFRAIAGNAFAGIASAEDFWRVEKRDTLGEAAGEERGVHFATAFDEETGDVFAAQLFQEPVEVNF